MSAQGQPTLVGTVVDGRYEVESELGRGAMGVVYRARHRMLGRWIALKVLRATKGTDHRLVARFVREAKTASSIGHPNICAVTDFGQLADGSVYLVMELSLGRSLADEVERNGRLSVERALGIAFQIADALSAAHAHGVVHRDLKPQHVLLEDGDFVRLIDFGIAKVDSATQALTQEGELMGTPLYMAPEQWTGRGVDPRTDVYAIGALIFEMLTGQPPFVATSMMGLLGMHLSDPPPDLLAHRSDAPDELGALVRACLAKSMEDRPRSMLDVMRALGSARAALAGIGYDATARTPTPRGARDLVIPPTFLESGPLTPDSDIPPRADIAPPQVALPAPAPVPAAPRPQHAQHGPYAQQAMPHYAPAPASSPYGAPPPASSPYGAPPPAFAVPPHAAPPYSPADETARVRRAPRRSMSPWPLLLGAGVVGLIGSGLGVYIVLKLLAREPTGPATVSPVQVVAPSGTPDTEPEPVGPFAPTEVDEPVPGAEMVERPVMEIAVREPRPPVMEVREPPPPVMQVREPPPPVMEVREPPPPVMQPYRPSNPDIQDPFATDP